MNNKVDAGRRGFRGRRSRRRNPLVLIALLLVVGNPSPSVHAEDVASSPAARAPASAAYARGSVWLLDLDPCDARRWLGSREPSKAKPLHRLRPASARWLLRAVEGSARAHIALRVDTPDMGQPRIAWKHVDAMTYVMDYEVEQRMLRKVADPVVDIVQHGSTGSLEVRRSRSGALVWHLGLTQASLTLPLASTQVFVGETGQKLTIQLPEVRLLGTTHQLPAGAGWFVVGHGLTHRKDVGAPARTQLALVRVAELPPALPAGAAPLAGPMQFLVEAALFDHPASPLPRAYEGKPQALESAGRWFDGLRGGAKAGVSDAAQRSGILMLPTILTFSDEEARIELTSDEGLTFGLDIHINEDPPQMELAHDPDLIGVRAGYTDADHPYGAWSDRLKAGEVLLLPLEGVGSTAAKSRAGRYLALRVRRVPLK